MSVQNGKIEKEFQKGEILIREGDLSDCAYILESGRAEVLKSLPGGESQVVGTLEQNDIFGELGLIDGFPRSATVKALAPCRVSILTWLKILIMKLMITWMLTMTL